MVPKKLTDYFYKVHNIDPNDGITIERVRARELITPERIDLVAKYKYVEFREKQYDMHFIREIYKAHIDVLTMGTNAEPGSESKNSIDRYFDVFEELIDHIKVHGVDADLSVIPVGKNNVILDGAHRTAIAAYYDYEIPITRFTQLEANYDSFFFEKNLLNTQYLEFLVQEYCKLKPNVYIACLWPKAKGDLHDRHLQELIRDKCKIVYRKQVKLNFDGLHNFISQIYSSHKWVGTIDNHYSGAFYKARECYDEQGSMIVYVLECDHFEDILSLKDKIREKYAVDKHSIHITDKVDESIQIANIVLNSNSIDFLNQGNPYKYKKVFHKMNLFKQSVLNNHESLNEYIVVSSTPLGLYGLRESNDLDFMTVSSKSHILKDDAYDNAEEYIELYGTTYSNLILNPSNYFVYCDVKFVALQALKVFKSARGEQKDLLDVKLIDSIITQNSPFKLWLYQLESWFSRNKRNSRYHYMPYIKKILKKLGLLERVQKIYDNLKKE